MVNVSVLGYGVVGSGVVDILKKNGKSIKTRAGEDIKVKRILDIRDFPESEYKELFTKNADDVFNDESIKIVVETIGGIGIAYEYTKRALKSGRHVVTSNKELVATHGPELLKIAQENNVRYLFEASVGGGIPIIRPLRQCLAANMITGITGILNGTTNYILTRMKKDGMDFDEALKGAQKNGYAEADPTADIEGHDACRKIAILSSIAYNDFVNYKNIPTEGIKNISLTDMKYADALNCTIKLIGHSRKTKDGIYAWVSPAMVGKDMPLAGVNDVFNAIVVYGDAIGEAMFYGPGAGKFPTASAVVADIIDIVSHPEDGFKNNWQDHNGNTLELTDPSGIAAKYFVRVKSTDQKEAKRAVLAEFGEDVKYLRLPDSETEDEFGFVCGKMPERQFALSVERLKKSGKVDEVVNKIRVLEG